MIELTYTGTYREGGSVSWTANDGTEYVQLHRGYGERAGKWIVKDRHVSFKDAPLVPDEIVLQFAFFIDHRRL